MRTAPLLLILLLVLPAATAEEKVIHDEWHPYQDFFTIGEDYYEVVNDHRLTEDEVRIQTLIKRNQASYIITANADLPDQESAYALAAERCKAEGMYRFCVANISYDPNKQARSDEAGRYRYGTRIKIYEDIPDTALLEITKAYEQSTLHYGEETKATITINNKGTLKATNIAYEEVAGEGLVFTNHKDYDQRLPNKLKRAIPELHPGQSATMQYWVRAEEYVNTSSLTSNITYDNPEPATATKKSALSIPWPYTSKLALSAQEADINDPLTITYTITNQEDDPLETNLTITLQDGITVNNHPGLERNGNKLTYRGHIDPESTKTLRAEVHSPYTGTYNVSARLQASVNDHDFTAEDHQAYKVKTNTITPSIVVSKTKMRSGEPVTIGFYLKNEDEDKAFFNIKGWAGSDFFNQTYGLDALAKDDQENVIFKPYNPPTTEGEVQDHLIAMGGTFQTQNGEEKTFYTERTITVIPRNVSILLTKQAAPASLKRGEEVTITVDVENVADSGTLFVQAHDEYDEDLEKTFGSTAGETYLYPGESRQLYVYRLKVPYGYTKSNFTVESRLTAKGQQYTTNSKTVEVLDPLEPTTTPSPTPAEEQPPAQTPTPTTQPSPAPEEEREEEPPAAPAAEQEGLLTKLIKGIANFFDSFFS